MVTGKNLYASTLILCCYGYQTGDNSELNSNCVIHDGSASFCDIKMFFQNNYILKFSYN